ncbi:MAG: LacI family transcriptional regulator [Clostridiales bacterium]|nr:LacI family transcriptional regulator [Clostridiales bacterium]
MAATMKDLARETGLSLGTISAYFNGKKIKPQNARAIEQAANKLHYYRNDYARGLKAHRSMTVVVVIQELNSSFCTKIIMKVEDILREHGYGVLICDCRSNAARETQALNFLMSKTVDGFLRIPVAPQDAIMDQAAQRGVPVVNLDRDTGRTDCCHILIDNAKAARQAAEHLISRGHREILLLTGSPELYTMQERSKGFLRAMEAHRIVLPDHYIQTSEPGVAGAYQSVRRLLDSELRFTALLTTNYEMTMGAALALNEGDLHIPEHCSLVGFDSMELARMVFSDLTLVCQPIHEIATQAARLLLEQMEQGQCQARKVVLEASLHEGGSVRYL